MSLGVQQLKSIAVVATRKALTLYDKGRQEGILPSIAQLVPSAGAQETQYIDWWVAFPQMREWVGERKLREVFADRISLTLKPFEQTFELDRMRVELDGDRSLVTRAEQLAMSMADGYRIGETEKAYDPLRNNVLTYDGQNLFDTDHTHPDGDTFSNVVDLSDLSAGRSSSGSPTATEAKVELELALDRLELNRLRRQSLTEAPEPGDLVVICKQFNTWKGYHDLLTQDIISNTTNTWKGKFRLLRDRSPVSGDEKKIDVVLSEPAGPRPALVIRHKMPSALEFDETSVFKNRMIQFGTDAIYAFGAGFPQPAVRIQE